MDVLSAFFILDMEFLQVVHQRVVEGAGEWWRQGTCLNYVRQLSRAVTLQERCLPLPGTRVKRGTAAVRIRGALI